MLQITLSANAGVSLRIDSLCLWADALHRRKVPGFSTVTPALWEAMAMHPGFAAPDILFYTHCHPDHFSRTLTLRALERWPDAKPVLPQAVFPEQLLLSGRRERLKLPGYTLDFLRLPHEGEQYAGVAHYACIIERQGFRILLPGDWRRAGRPTPRFWTSLGSRCERDGISSGSTSGQKRCSSTICPSPATTCTGIGKPPSSLRIC